MTPSLFSHLSCLCDGACPPQGKDSGFFITTLHQDWNLDPAHNFAIKHLMQGYFPYYISRLARATMDLSEEVFLCPIHHQDPTLYYMKIHLRIWLPSWLSGWPRALEFWPLVPTSLMKMNWSMVYDVEDECITSYPRTIRRRYWKSSA